MGLAEIAPSILALRDTDRAQAGTPDPVRRLTVLTGAGASIFAGAPSTEQLTEVASRRAVSGAILRVLHQQRDRLGPTFEDVLHVLEELELLRSSSPARASRVLQPFIDSNANGLGAAPDFMTFRRERLGLMEDIAAAFDGVAYDASWRTLYRLLRPFLNSYNIDVFTLNYDLVCDTAVFALSMLSGKKWFDGFGGPIDMDGSAGFRSDQYATWKATPLYMTLGHIHGSLRYSYHLSDMRMAHATPVEIVQATSIALARKCWRGFHEAAASQPDFDLSGISPIISGLRKAEKLNVRPYANYFHGFAQAVSKSPNLLIIGYGNGDEHINYWIREFSLIHRDGRVIEVTNETNPERFTIQQYGAYDLRWERRSKALYVNRMGARCLTFTDGVTLNGQFPTNEFLEQLDGGVP